MEKQNRRDLLATEATSLQDEFKVQINAYDSYLTTPSLFDRSSPPGATAEDYSYHHVPIIRVFGSLPTGHNILVHIHGVFPYVFIPFDNQPCFEFHKKLEAAVALSLNRKNEKEDSEEKESKVFKYIANVDICKGVPFYGYHVGYECFYKISLLNPSYVNRVADLLRNGSVCGKNYDVFEAHIPLPLQFLTDFNLFGCGWLKLRDLHIRLPILYDESLKTEELVDYLMGYNTIALERIGTGALEIDALAQNILNRDDLSERYLHHDFIEKFNPLESSIYIQSIKDLWKDGDYQRKLKNIPSYTPIAQTQRVPNSKWVDSEENEKLFDYVKNLNARKDKLEFETFVKSNEFLNDLPTAFELLPNLFYQPEFETTPSQDESTHIEINETEEFEDYLKAFNNGAEDFPNCEDYDDKDDLYGSDDVHDINEAEDEAEDVVIDQFESPLTAQGDPSPIENGTDIFFTQHMNKSTAKRKFIQAFSETPLHLKLPKTQGQAFLYKPPRPIDIDFEGEGLPRINYDDPFYMEKPPQPYIYAGKKFKLKSKLVEYMDKGDINGETLPELQDSKIDITKSSHWKYLKEPPSYENVKSFSVKPKSSQINISHKFKFGTQHNIERRPDGFNNLTLLAMELSVITRDEFNPDPKTDAISAIFWKSVNGANHEEGILITGSDQPIWKYKSNKYDSELDMIENFLTFVVSSDPDIIAGYEIHSSSWGYLIDRAKYEYEISVLDNISRVSFKSHNKHGDHWGYTHTSSIRICGRHILNIWRPLRELKLGRSSVEHAAYHLLHQRIPKFSYSSLTKLFESDVNSLVEYYMKRVDVDVRLIEAADLILRATEEARLIGVEFYDVYYRGSQYKVESIMLRLAKAENFILFSPSKKQVRKQKPLECIPLVMEPMSAYYKSPLIVLDFQSLYPSIMIAYNYCYSTLLGRLKNYKIGSNSIGVTKVSHSAGLLKLLENDINLSPNGLMFVKPSVRKSLLAKMLEDLLDTRFMVKSTMKFLDDNLKKLYNNRQLAIKLTANVVYGYTSASFSGRMPCSDISDAIVQSGRETLEKAITLIEEEANWGAKVVYGDTDSLFVYLPGKSIEEAFKFGKEMADKVTKNNPDPVTLKFEKVYHPSVLLAKKRYVGYSYEELGAQPKFDAKGIETVRRDGHAAQQHIVEHCLRTLFETNNITNIKDYVLDQFNKIIYNDVSIQDFCFAKDVKIGTYKNPPPGAVVSRKKMDTDSGTEPQYKERVPYVIIQDHGKILRDRARAPEDFIKNNEKLDSEYYIVKTLIPPLERIFNLLGVNVRQWYHDMPKKAKNIRFFQNTCLCCGLDSKENLCSSCKQDELQTILNLKQNMKKSENKVTGLLTLCRSCTNNSALCESHDCPVYFATVREQKKLKELDNEKELLKQYLDW